MDGPPFSPPERHNGGIAHLCWRVVGAAMLMAGWLFSWAQVANRCFASTPFGKAFGGRWGGIPVKCLRRRRSSWACLGLGSWVLHSRGGLWHGRSCSAGATLLLSAAATACWPAHHHSDTTSARFAGRCPLCSAHGGHAPLAGPRRCSGVAFALHAPALVIFVSFACAGELSQGLRLAGHYIYCLSGRQPGLGLEIGHYHVPSCSRQWWR